MTQMIDYKKWDEYIYYWILKLSIFRLKDKMKISIIIKMLSEKFFLIVLVIHYFN